MKGWCCGSVNTVLTRYSKPQSVFSPELVEVGCTHTPHFSFSFPYVHLCLSDPIEAFSVPIIAGRFQRGTLFTTRASLCYNLPRAYRHTPTGYESLDPQARLSRGCREQREEQPGQNAGGSLEGSVDKKMGSLKQHRANSPATFYPNIKKHAATAILYFALYAHWARRKYNVTK